MLNFLRYVFHPLFCQFHPWFAEVHVGFGLQRNEVDVGVWHFHAEHGDTDTLAWNSGFERERDLACEGGQTLVGDGVESEDVVTLRLFRNDQGVSFRHG